MAGLFDTEKPFQARYLEKGTFVHGILHKTKLSGVLLMRVLFILKGHALVLFNMQMYGRHMFVILYKIRN